MKLLFTKGPSLFSRLLYAILLSLVLLTADTQLAVFSKINSLLQTMLSPFYYLSSEPNELLLKLHDKTRSKASVEQENQQLQQKILTQQSQLQELAQLKQENSELRVLLGAPSRTNVSQMMARVLSLQTDSYNYQIVLNRGSKDKVYSGQPLIDSRGIVGQIVTVGYNTSRALLICDPLSGVPVQDLSNDDRAIIMGDGCDHDLLVEYFPNNTQIKAGDTLVTSGLDSKFPEGYPVAVVKQVINDHKTGKIEITAKPIANLNKLRYVLLLNKEGSTTSHTTVSK